MDTDRLDASLRSLDPSDRALLELSLRQRIPDHEIADLLQSEVAEVERQRELLLVRLAVELEVNENGEGVERVAVAIQGTAATVTPAGTRVARPRRAEPREEGDDDREAARIARRMARAERRGEDEEPAARRRGRGRFVLLALAIVALGAVGTILIAGGDEDKGDKNADRAPKTGGAPAEKPPAKEPAGEPARTAKLRAVSGVAAGAEGTAAIEGKGKGARLQLSASNLPEPDGAYEVWLYDSLIDSVRVATVRGTSIELSERLPADPAKYRYVDISLEPADGNPNHSGRSVLRVPVRDLLGG